MKHVSLHLIKQIHQDLFVVTVMRSMVDIFILNSANIKNLQVVLKMVITKKMYQEL